MAYKIAQSIKPPEFNSGLLPVLYACSGGLLLGDSIMDSKQCSQCKEQKYLTEFYERTDQAGFRSMCKKCFLSNCTQRKTKNMHKINAKVKLRTELLAGRISPSQRCQSCGKAKKVDGHHPDYNMPLAVLWLCRSCHMKLHRIIRLCSIIDCNNKHRSKGLCSTHYQRQYRLLRKAKQYLVLQVNTECDAASVLHKACVA